MATKPQVRYTSRITKIASAYEDFVTAEIRKIIWTGKQTQKRQQSPERWLLLFVRERSINEQRTVCKSADVLNAKQLAEALHYPKPGLTIC